MVGRDRYIGQSFGVRMWTNVSHRQGTQGQPSTKAGRRRLDSRVYPVVIKSFPIGLFRTDRRAWRKCYSSISSHFQITHYFLPLSRSSASLTQHQPTSSSLSPSPPSHPSHTVPPYAFAPHTLHHSPYVLPPSTRHSTDRPHSPSTSP